MPIQARSFSELISFTRASNATYFDSAGVLRTATSNVPRFDYNPITLAIRGLLVEEQRINSIRNNTMVGAVAGTPGTLPQVSGSASWAITGVPSGITRTIVGTGTENGITYIDIQLSGTPGASADIQIFPETSPGVAATTSQTWTCSFYVKLAAGATTNISAWRLNLIENSNVPAFLRQTISNINTPTSSSLATQRVSASVTTGASIAFVQSSILFSLTSGAAIDITLRIGLPQLEQGAFATSVISTTTAAATRSADVASINFLDSWYNDREGTLYVEFSRPSPAALSFASELSDNTFNEFIGIYTDNIPNLIAQVRDGGGSQAFFTLVSGPGTANLTYKQAIAFVLNNFAACSDGGTVGTDTLGTLPSPSRLNIGNFNGSSQFTNGYIRKIKYYPRRLTNAELQAITT